LAKGINGYDGQVRAQKHIVVATQTNTQIRLARAHLMLVMPVIIAYDVNYQYGNGRKANNAKKTQVSQDT